MERYDAIKQKALARCPHVVATHWYEDSMFEHLTGDYIIVEDHYSGCNIHFQEQSDALMFKLKIK